MIIVGLEIKICFNQSIKFFSVISVIPIDYDEFMHLNAQNSHFETNYSFSDPFYIMVNDGLAMAEPSRVIF